MGGGASVTPTAQGNNSVAESVSGSYGEEGVLINHSDLLHWLGVYTSPGDGAELNP